MKSFVLAATAAVLLSGAAITSANAASLWRHDGLTAHERAAIARSEHQLDALKSRVRADGHVTIWERTQVRLAQLRHDALVYRYRHN